MISINSKIDKTLTLFTMRNAPDGREAVSSSDPGEYINQAADISIPG